MASEHFIPEIEPEAQKLLVRRVKQHKIIGSIFSVCMIIVGILMLTVPGDAAFAVNYSIAIGVLLMGIYELIVFFRTKASFRNEGTLASGIILVLMGAIILAFTIGNPSNQDAMLAIFAAVLGFYALYRGIMQFFSYGRFRDLEETSCGWLLMSGILNSIIGVLMIVLPFTGFLGIGIILGIYLIVAGVALFTEAISGKIARRK